MNPKVDFYFNKEERWPQEIGRLREIVLGTGLDEVLKWGCPCYVLGNANVVLIHTFKEYCALLFFQGALLTDPEQLLVQQTENVQAARQMRFTGMGQIGAQQSFIERYIREATEIARSGKKFELKKTEEFTMPEEFRQVLDTMADVQAAFESLTPGRQRGYLLHFAAPKQSKTRVSRIEKAIPDILEGRGLND